MPIHLVEDGMPKSECKPSDSFSPEAPAAPAAAMDACPDCGDIYHAGQPHECKVTVLTDVSNPLGMAPLAVAGHLGEREDIQRELDGIAAAIRMMHVKPADQVMRECSAYSSRLTELQVLLARVETIDRQYLKVRTQQVERFLSEIDRQYKIASRLIEAQRQDLALMGGMQ